MSAYVERCVGRGMAWLRNNPAPADDIVRLADEAWFYKMLLLRHGAFRTHEVAAWAKSLDHRLDAALRINVGTYLGPRDSRDSLAWCEQAMGALMLAHLLWLCRRDGAGTAEFVSHVHRHFAAYAKELFQVSPLHNFCFDYNFTEMGLNTPGNPQTIPTFENIAGTEGLITASYYHTHVILFAFGTFSREPANLDALNDSLRFIREHVRTVIRYGWIDLCAEFALCLSLCNSRNVDFAALVNALVRLQPEDGRWTHPWCDDRQSRHSTMMSILALLEALRSVPDREATYYA
jgi:hypothetical protein